MITGKNNLRCGLIGKTLSHSFSPRIHGLLADYSYKLFEMSECEVGKFIRGGDFDALNVTIPYKKTVIPYLDEISEEARRIGSVNTVTRLSDGRLRGDNTDYFGFSYMLKKANIAIEGKKVLILGTGGASLTAQAVCSDLGAREIVLVSRNGDVNYENVYEKHPDGEVIINCTPVGMYPNNQVSPISLSRFSQLSGVADMVYNPATTELLFEAQSLKIPCTNGLSMLVAQAKRACELFLDTTIDNGVIDEITAEIEKTTKNIVLVGMPGCGKSTVGAILSEMMGRKLVDTDEMISKSEGRDIPTIFNSDGEDYFRSAEHNAVAEAGKQSSLIISTGGGVVTRGENYRPLKQNGVIFYIQRNINFLSRDGRPLSQNGDLEEMFQKRRPMYEAFCDYKVKNGTTAIDCAKEILNIFRGGTDK